MTVEELKYELDKYPNDAGVIVSIEGIGKGTPTHLFWDKNENELYIEYIDFN